MLEFVKPTRSATRGSNYPARHQQDTKASRGRLPRLAFFRSCSTGGWSLRAGRRSVGPQTPDLDGSTPSPATWEKPMADEIQDTIETLAKEGFASTSFSQRSSSQSARPSSRSNLPTPSSLASTTSSATNRPKTPSWSAATERDENRKTKGTQAPQDARSGVLKSREPVPARTANVTGDRWASTVPGRFAARRRSR